jgi:Cu/Ag efflux protein CusF
MLNPTPVTRSRLPFVAIGVWAAILAAIVAVGLVFGGRGANAADNAPAGAAGITLTAPLAADPSPGSSAAPGASGAPANPGTPGQAGKGPNGFAFGRGPGGPGPGGPGGPGRGFGAVSITAINGSQLSLKTDDGWTRTIDAAGATVTEADGTAITLADLKVGDQIGFRQTRNADGTYTVTQIVRIPPQASGTVKSVDANSATLTLPDGTTKTIGLTSSTTYTLNGNAATAADLKVGTRVHATGTVDANGNFTATKVAIAPADVHGTVTAKSGNTITLKDQAGASVTVNVDGSTTYASRGSTAAGLADIAVGDVLEAEGTLNADGSLTATRVEYGTPGQGGFGGPGFGGPGFHGPGGHRGPGGNGNGNGTAPNASPVPSTSGG